PSLTQKAAAVTTGGPSKKEMVAFCLQGMRGPM
ncbi:unnamed protein product, partial [marine sediment metagenome]